tara:strand:+ start:4930 stop:5811 length:882 start_codon:yes stop_codon:yes gene_type:complete
MSDFLVVITRVKNENMMLKSFIPYYLSQGVDKIYLMDDNSTEPYSQDILNNPKVIIEKQTKGMQHPEWIAVQHILHKEQVQKNTTWVIGVDCDEFITTRKNPNKTIKQELIDNFSQASCIKIPWVMFSRNKRVNNPDDVISDITWRWNYDKTHVMPNGWSRKFSQPGKNVEVKCIWKPSHFKSQAVHHPHNPSIDNPIIVDGVYNQPARIEINCGGSLFFDLNEKKIHDAYFTCNHYRIVSEQHARQKCNPDSCTLYRDTDEKNILQKALAYDFPDIQDTLLKDKYEKLIKMQ